MDVIIFILVFILNRCGICGDAQNEAVLVCGSPFNEGLGFKLLHSLEAVEPET